jgi:hypothetical protein
VAPTLAMTEGNPVAKYLLVLALVTPAPGGWVSGERAAAVIRDPEAGFVATELGLLGGCPRPAPPKAPGASRRPCRWRYSSSGRDA